MYPNLYYAFKDLFGIEINGLKLVNSFGFFVALSFILSAWILTVEFRRKQGLGLFEHTEEKIKIGEPASLSELITNGLLGFLFGYKIIGAFTIKNA
ncbi:MAG: diacylglyceryl transferase, partial [Sediminibacterium sp.]|nr:diacylglyceryl transferase [Sediminibacterium sp.]